VLEEQVEAEEVVEQSGLMMERGWQMRQRLLRRTSCGLGYGLVFLTEQSWDADRREERTPELQKKVRMLWMAVVLEQRRSGWVEVALVHQAPSRY